MRIYEKISLKISEDASSDPKNIRFAEEVEDTNTELLPEVVVRQEIFPVGSHNIPLGNIAEGRYLFIKPTAQITFKLNNGTDLTLRAGKVFRAWINFTQLDITVSSNPAQVVLFAAGA